MSTIGSGGTPRVARWQRRLLALTAGMAAVIPAVVLGSAVPASAQPGQTLSPATVGVPYSAQVAYSDSSGGPYTFSAQTSLPPGLTISPAGLVSGTPTEELNEPVSTTFDINVAEPGNQFANAIDASVVVTPPNWTPPPPLQFTTTTLPAATLGQPYSATIDVSGGVQPYQWGVGEDPPGLTFTVGPSSATLSGTPTQVGSFQLELQVADAKPNIGTVSLNGTQDETFTFTVSSGIPTLDPVLAPLTEVVTDVLSILPTADGLVQDTLGQIESNCLVPEILADLNYGDGCVQVGE